MRDLSMHLAIFALVIVIADIILALTLCFSLPYHASRRNYYPPFGSVVDIDTATIYCPCLNKYLEEFRGINNVRFLRPAKNETIEDDTKLTEIQKYPYLVSVQTQPPYPRYVCDGYVTTDGKIIVSYHCSTNGLPSGMLNMTVRSGSSHLDKFGNIHKVVSAVQYSYLYLLSVTPVIKDTTHGVAALSGSGNPQLSLVPKDDLLILHSWDVYDNETTSEFKTVLFRSENRCHQERVHYCFQNDKFVNYSRHVLLDFCKKVVVGLKYDNVDGMPVEGYQADCAELFVGSCLDKETESKHCSNLNKKSLVV